MTAVPETDATTWGPVLLTRDGPVARLTIANPGRKNAVSGAGWACLRDAAAAVSRSDARVLVVTGQGTDFCAGADLSATGDEHPLVDMHVVNEACLALHRAGLPTIARVDGYAVGAGMNLALACDFVVATDRAQFSEIFVKRGLSVDFGGSWLLPRLVGLHRAKSMVMLGEMLGAGTLRDLGVVREVVPPERLDEVVGKLAEQLAAGPPMALLQSKRMLHDSFEGTLERALEDEARAQAINMATEDAAEAGRAFSEKRTPVFRGC